VRQSLSAALQTFMRLEQLFAVLKYSRGSFRNVCIVAREMKSEVLTWILTTFF